MYELIQAGPRSLCINSPVKIGVHPIDDGKVCLIDNDNDKDAGHKICQILEQEEWSLHIIINTHSNADHIDGSKYLMQQTGCRIYISSMEAALIKHPILEPAFLYGNYPFEDLRRGFLVAQESDISDVSRLSEDQLLKDLELIPLPGHFSQTIGIRTPDDTVLLADYLSSRVILEKYRVSFICNVTVYLEILDKVTFMKANLFVPTHVEVSYSVVALASYNRDCVMKIKELLLELRRVPRIFKTLLKEVFDRYGLVMTFQQHVLVGSMIRSCLSWLKDMNEMEVYVEENCLYWGS